MAKPGTFTFVDLFSGIGGFHAALHGMGGNCVLASDVDGFAREVYKSNWGIVPHGDITKFSTPSRVFAPPSAIPIDVLTAGFPCQPFSKSGHQRGMNDSRGTLFDHIMYIVEKRAPKLVVLENVRNLAGPRHRHEFEYVVDSLRNAGYLVSGTPTIFSPHRIAPEFGGRPQIRERLFITATYCPRRSRTEPTAVQLSERVRMGDVQSWSIVEYLDTDEVSQFSSQQLTQIEVQWLNAWDDLQREIRKERGSRLPSHPLWADYWTTTSTRARQSTVAGLPDWKRRIVVSNWDFFDQHAPFISSWMRRHDIPSFPPTRRKFEWQAQDEKSLWDCAIQLRPSGIRVKRLSYLPAFVAMNQTSIIGPLRRRITVREAARLQGLPDSFDFGSQPESQSYKQLGNGVNVGVIWQVIKAHAERDENILAQSAPNLLSAIKSAPRSPDVSDLFPDLRNAS